MPERYFIINKPYNMVSQFIGEEKADLLSALDYDFPEGIHAIGRLDSNSEGLLILTTNKKITRLLFMSDVPHKRTYLVRVKNRISPEKLELLRTGVTIRIKTGIDYVTPPCEVELVTDTSCLFPHQLELREYVPHSWLRISIYQGKYHQVRKMVSAAGHPCKRLVRIAIEDLELGDLAPGCVKELDEETFFRLLKIKNQ